MKENDSCLITTFSTLGYFLGRLYLCLYILNVLPASFKISTIIIIFREKNISYSGLNNLSLSEWLQDLEPKLYLLVLLEKMMLAK